MQQCRNYFYLAAATTQDLYICCYDGAQKNVLFAASLYLSGYVFSFYINLEHSKYHEKL